MVCRIAKECRCRTRNTWKVPLNQKGATFRIVLRSSKHLVRIPVGAETQQCSDIPDAIQRVIRVQQHQGNTVPYDSWHESLANVIELPCGSSADRTIRYQV